MKIIVEEEKEKDKIFTRKADKRGRITLGSRYANEKVTIAIVEEDSYEK